MKCRRVWRDLIMKYILLTVFLSPTYCQFMDMKADVTFGEHNDRFDITSIVDQQNRLYDETEVKDLDEYRRSGVDINQLAAALRENVRNNKDFSEFAYHDQMESDERDEDYEKNLREFKNRRKAQKLVRYLHGNKGRRRSDGFIENPEKEMLFHYAVPVDLKINGYLQVPMIE